MPGVSYTVTATLPNEDTRQEYIRWLAGGHTDQVIRGGAASAQIVQITDPASPLEVQARYVFPSREALDVYLRDHAPKLRKDGMDRFGATVTFRRQVGTILT